jgi:uncharacterized membrane protein YgcG
MTWTSTLRHTLALVFLLPALALAQATEAPMPASVLKYVPPSPNPEGFIRDVPGVLGNEHRRRLNARITTIQEHIHGDIGVAILSDIGDIPPYEVGTAIYRAWKIGTVAPIGNARRDVGVLVLLVPKELAPNHEGQCWITTGRGSEGAVTDAAAATICRDRVIPAMKARAYAAAVDSAITGIEHLYLVGLDSLTAAQSLPLARDIAAPLSRQDDGASRQGGAAAWLDAQDAATLVLLGVLAVLAFYGIVRGIGHYLRVRPRPCPKGHGNMRLLSEEEDDTEIGEGGRFEEQIKSVNYDVWRCPAAGCSERLVIPRKKWMSGYSDCPHCHRRALTSSTVTLVAATQISTGLEETTTTCAFCKKSRTTRHVTPVLPPPPPPSSSSSSSSFGGSSGGSSGGSGSSSFGGSGSTAGGGGGGSY